MSEQPLDSDRSGAGTTRTRSRHQRHIATTTRLHALRPSGRDEATLLEKTAAILCESFAARGVQIAPHLPAPGDAPIGVARQFFDDFAGDAPSQTRPPRLLLDVRPSDGEILRIAIEHPFDGLSWDARSEDLRDDLAHLEELGRVFVDVLDAERMLARLKLREAELSSMLGAVPDILTIIDASGVIVEFHNGDERHALDPASFIGRHVAELVPPEVWRAAHPVWQRAIATRRVQEHRYSIERADGRTLYFVSRGQAYGEPARVLWHTRDVTEERRLQERLLSIQRFEGIALLASALAHDFSNLLTGILGNAEFARIEIGGGSPVADALGDVISAARRASDLCQQLLGMSGKRRFSLGFVNLSRLCEEMLVILRTSIGRRVSVVRELTEPDAMPVLIGDAIQLRQIVLNLLSNAADAIGDDGGVITVRTGTQGGGEGDGQWAYLEVEDSGRGMDEPARRRLLSPYWSVPLEARELGLAATFGIVRGHGGTVEVGLAESGGTRVRVLLPLEQEAEASAHAQAVAGATPGARVDDGLPTGLERGGLVLVVTSDPTLVAVCRRTLEQAGHRVQHIGSGDEALIALRAIAGLARGIVLDMDSLGPGTVALAGQIQGIAPAIPCLVVGGGAAPGALTPLQTDRPLTFEALDRALARLLAEL